MKRLFWPLAALVVVVLLAHCTGTASSACSANNCRGCCDSQGACLTGNANAACGTAGATCTACQGSQSCNQGQCTGAAACNAFTCTGCCAGNTCVTPSNTDTQCGTGGNACDNCTTTGGTCNGGACSGGSCNAGNCNGCCGGGVCKSGTSNGFCGTSGNACTACTGAQACSAGVCTNPGGCADAGASDGGPPGLATYCNSSTTCASLNCLTFMGSGGMCSGSCNGCDNACPTGGRCFNLGAYYCVQACDAGCPANDVCETSTVGDFCVPDCRVHPDICPDAGSACDSARGICISVGNQGYAQPCGGGAGACTTAGQCIVLSSGAATGFCTQKCTQDGGTPCPSTPDSGQCAITDGTNWFCGFPCSGPTDMTCPAGLHCKATSAGSFFCW